jgi:hypothetical protein
MGPAGIGGANAPDGQRQSRGTRRSRSSASGRLPDARRPRLAVELDGGDATIALRTVADVLGDTNAAAPASMQPNEGDVVANRAELSHSPGQGDGRGSLGSAATDFGVDRVARRGARLANAGNSRAD